MIKFINDQPIEKLAGKRVLLRLDLNVPISQGKILDASRIERSLMTLDYLISVGVEQVIIISHLGRPKGIRTPEASLEIIASYLQGKGYNLEFIESDIRKDGIADYLKSSPSSIIMLENIRFYSEEEAGDSEFAKTLSALADVYINDAFACSHRAHASIAQIAEFLPSYGGMLMQEELHYLSKLIPSDQDIESQNSVMAIIAGKKVSSKYMLIENLIDKLGAIFIAGAMANTFLSALGHDVGDSYIEKEFLSQAKNFATKAGYIILDDQFNIDDINQKDSRLLLPGDFVCLTAEDQVENSRLGDFLPGDKAMDIGPKTMEILTEILCNHRYKRVLWNGPLGVYEDARFSEATNILAKELAGLCQAGDDQHKFEAIAGGGDVVAAINNAGVIDDFTYISTAGGAFLEYLEGKDLPGLRALES